MEIKSITANWAKHKTSTNGQSDEEKQFSIHEPRRNPWHHSCVIRRTIRRNRLPGALRAFDSATSLSLLRYQTQNPTIQRPGSTWLRPTSHMNKLEKDDALRARRPTPARTDQPEPAGCATLLDEELLATPTVLSMTPTRQSGRVFGITSNTLALSGQRPCIDRYGGAPTAAGWGEDCWTGPPISSPPGHDPSHCSDTPTYILTCT